jgi:hypothetical protein
MYRDFKDVPKDEVESARQLAKHHVEVHGYGCPDEITELVAQMIATHDCVDNLRVARVDNDQSVQRYALLADNGSGAELDFRETVGGVMWMYGCNYGD